MTKLADIEDIKLKLPPSPLSEWLCPSCKVWTDSTHWLFYLSTKQIKCPECGHKVILE